MLDTRNLKSSHVKGPSLSKTFVVEGAFLPRPFLVKGPLLSQALSCQRPFLVKGPLLSQESGKGDSKVAKVGHLRLWAR